MSGGDKAVFPLKCLSSSSEKLDPSWYGNKWPIRQLSDEGCLIPGENFYKAIETSKRGQISV